MNGEQKNTEDVKRESEKKEGTEQTHVRHKAKTKKQMTKQRKETKQTNLKKDIPKVPTGMNKLPCLLMASVVALLVVTYLSTGGSRTNVKRSKKN